MTTSSSRLPVLMGPLIFFQIYLLFTILLFRFGPWQYFNRSSNEILFFALLYQVALAAGYLLAHGTYRSPARTPVSVGRLITLSILANLVIFPLTSLGRTGQVWPDVVGGLSDPGGSYSQTIERIGQGTGAAVEYLRILLGPLLFLYFPLGVFFWSKLGRKTRGWVVGLILLHVALYIAMGTNKAIGDFAVSTPLLMVAAICAGLLRLNTKRLLAGVAIVAALTGLFGSFFAATMASREGSSIATGYFPPGNTRLDPAHPLLQNLSSTSQTLVAGISNYVTQGYFAMGLALREPFVSLYGLGTSPFILRQYQSLTGQEEVAGLTYPARLEKYGWLEERYWSSIYLWVASDLSFWGIPLFCFVLGWLLYTTWRDAVEARNPWAVALVALHIIVLFYFSSNNQIGQSGEALWAYLVLTFLWLTGRAGLRFVLIRRPT